MNTTKSVYNKLFSEDKTELSKHEVHLALMDELANISMEAGSLLTLQAQQMAAFDKLEKSIALNKKGLADAEKGLKAAQDLGVKDAIDAFKRWVKGFSDDIKRAEKGKKLVAELDNF